MRALKHIAGVLLATFGTTLTLGGIEFLYKGDRNGSGWVIAVEFVLLGLLPLSGAFFLLRKHITEPTKPCPSCGSAERRRASVLRRSPSLLVRHLGGWWLPALWGASRGKQFQCVQCETVYLTDTRSSRVAKLVLWIFLLIWVFAIIVEICKAR